jgi:hypothetical protein
MAQKVLVEMVDDIDGEVATQTVPFGLDGVSYEIDLSEENAARLREEGYGVSQRGRIPTEVSDAFEQAQRAPVVSEPVVVEPAKTPRKRATRKKAPANA